MVEEHILGQQASMAYLKLVMAILNKLSKEENKKLLKEWKEYLSFSRLSEKDINKRAKEFTRKRMRPNE